MSSPTSSVSSSTSLSSSYTPTTSTSAQLYVPVHKRAASLDRTSSRIVSTLSPPLAIAPPVYTPATLRALAASPLARLPAPARADLRARVPELVLNRRMRKSIEWHSHNHPHEHVEGRQADTDGYTFDVGLDLHDDESTNADSDVGKRSVTIQLSTPPLAFKRPIAAPSRAPRRRQGPRWTGLAPDEELSWRGRTRVLPVA